MKRRAARDAFLSRVNICTAHRGSDGRFTSWRGHQQQHERRKVLVEIAIIVTPETSVDVRSCPETARENDRNDGNS
jgi:hypothetical protein